MALTRTHNSMLNQYLPTDLLANDFNKRMYVLQNIKKYNDWKSGTLIVPFTGAQPTSMAFGSLTGATDIHEATYVRGQITSQPEVSRTLYFNSKDFAEHEGTTREQSFVRSLKRTIPGAVDYFKSRMSLHWLGGPHFGTAIQVGGVDNPNLATGEVWVDRVERFTVGQKVIWREPTNPSNVVSYVSTIDVNTNEVVFVTARGGAVGSNLSNMTVANGGRCYEDGLINAATSAVQNNFDSFRNVLLSNANGGGATVYGQTKTAYPYLQGINASGATITAANILEQIFTQYVTVDRKSPGDPSTVVMSYRNFGNILIALESYQGAYNITPGSSKTSAYKWRTIQIGSPSGVVLTLAAVPECDDDVIYFMDWKTWELHSNGLFRYEQDPETGERFFKQRATTGYSYILDVYLFGEIVCLNPCANGIIHSISY